MLVVTLRVVPISLALAVHEGFDAAMVEHLHHHRGAASRQAADDRDDLVAGHIAPVLPIPTGLQAILPATVDPGLHCIEIGLILKGRSASNRFPGLSRVFAMPLRSFGVAEVVFQQVGHGVMRLGERGSLLQRQAERGGRHVKVAQPDQGTTDHEMRPRIVEEEIRRFQCMVECFFHLPDLEKCAGEPAERDGILRIEFEGLSIRRCSLFRVSELHEGSGRLQVGLRNAAFRFDDMTQERECILLIPAQHHLGKPHPGEEMVHGLEIAHRLADLEGQLLRRILEVIAFDHVTLVGPKKLPGTILVDLHGRQPDPVPGGFGREFLEGIQRDIPLFHDVLHESRRGTGQPIQILYGAMTADQVDPETVLAREFTPDSLEKRNRLVEDTGIHVGLCKVVLEFSNRLPNRHVDVLVRLLDVAELDELPHGFRTLDGIDVGIGIVHAALTLDVIPGFDRLHLDTVLECIDQRLAVHVPSDRQAEESQDGRTEIHDARTVDPMVLLDARTLHQEDSVIPVLDRRPRRLHRNVLGTKMIGVEAMVAEQDHRRVLTSELQGCTQHHVMEPVAAFDDTLVVLEVLLGDPLLTRRVESHEPMREVVDAVEVDAHQVPVLELDQGSGCTMDRDGVGEGLRESDQPLVLLLVDLREVRNEGCDMFRLDLPWMEPELLQVLRHGLRMHGPRLHRPLLEIPAELA